jgi:murein DD-endopeptidase MepM/ murein hydrolase activator NlpD
VKLLVLPAAGLIVGLLAFPALFATGDTPATPCATTSGPVEVVLATIRTIESGGDYTARAVGSTASGAYQFLDSSWAGYGGYPHAWQAPPLVQDAKAADLAQHVLDAQGGDVAAVPVVWYIGHVPADNSTEWDRIPAPGAGNKLTPRQYQTRWLATYDRLLAATPTTTTVPDSTPTTTPATTTAGCQPGVSITPIDGGWAYPGPAALFAVAPVDTPHHDYPAWDWMLPVGTPIYAVRGGTVTTVQYWPHNWWDQGCTDTTPGCVTCGIGVTIIDGDGNHWAYCHGSDVHVHVGQTVTAGTQILTSGNTGRSGGPHVHIQIKTVDGQLRCPQPLLRSLQTQGRGLDPATLPMTGCFFASILG